MPDSAAARFAIESRWIILGALFLARTAMGFQFQSIASTAPFLIRDLQLGYAEIGTLIGLYMLPGVFIALPGGLVAGRFADKSVCATGLAMMMLGGVLVGISHDYALAFLGRLFSGIGAVLFSLVLTKMVTDWFAGREIVFAMGVFLASWPFGIALGLLVQNAVATELGWPAVMHSTAGLCALALVLVGAVYRPPPHLAASPTAVTVPPLALPRSAEMVPAVIAGLIWGCFNLGLIIFFSFAPSLLVEQGTPPLSAASLTSTALWITMISVPLGGYLVQRSGRPDGAIIVFCCVAGLALAALSRGTLPALLCAIIGLSIGPPAGAIMALPARVLSAANRAMGLGVFYTAYYAVVALGPGLAGLARDLSGTAAAAIFFGAAFFAVGAPLLWAFRRLSPASA